MERILQQTQANLLNSIPDLELSNQVDNTSSQPPSSLDEVEFSFPVSPLPGMSIHSCIYDKIGVFFVIEYKCI